MLVTRKNLLFEQLTQSFSPFFLKRSKRSSTNDGFTMIEMIIVVIIVSILSAIAAPSWLSFVNQRRVTATSDDVWGAIREAQSEAKKNKISYSISFRNKDGFPQYAVYETDNIEDYIVNNQFLAWQNLGRDLDLKSGQIELRSDIAAGDYKSIKSKDYPTITFDDIGALHSDSVSDPNPNNDDNPEGFGVTVVLLKKDSTPSESVQRCVKIATLLGSIRQDRGSQCSLSEFK